jgi:hypothetical protein
MTSKLFFGLIILLFSVVASAQPERKDKAAVTFEEIYDEPYSVQKFFIGIQPIYGEVFATNVTAGFGAEASYYYKDKMDFKAHFRKSYGASFYDFERQTALNNSNVQNAPEIFNYFELGATYHIKDFEGSGKTKMVLYKNSYKGNRWASRVPLHAEVPCKVRKIYGVRLGGLLWNSTTDLNRALKVQGLTNTDLVNSAGIGLPISYVDPTSGKAKDVNVFGNIYSTAAYLGGSMSWFRNVAVSFDKYEEGLDDGMITVFFDILYAPQLKIDPIRYIDTTTGIEDSYSASAIKTSPLGFRVGVDGKYNRQLGWSYGGEVGYRPSISGRSFYAMVKIAFPLFGTSLDYKVESFGK